MKHILTLITSLVISSIIFLNGINGQGLPVHYLSVEMQTEKLIHFIFTMIILIQLVVIKE